MKAEVIPLVLLVAVMGLFQAMLNVTSQPLAITTPPQTGVIVMPVPTPAALIGPPSGILEAAQRWLGTPYLWGGCTHRGIDCSCFYMNVMAAINVPVARTTSAQIASFAPISRGQEQLGDAIFFDNTCTDCGPNPTHVGMVIGGGLMIHAGDPVHIESYQTPRWQSLNPRIGRPRGL
jgi:cell wall-associated NlpC family hydrolase